MGSMEALRTVMSDYVSSRLFVAKSDFGAPILQAVVEALGQAGLEQTLESEVTCSLNSQAGAAITLSSAIDRFESFAHAGPLCDWSIYLSYTDLPSKVVPRL